MTPPAQRKADERRRRAAQGLKRVEVWIPLRLEPELKKYAAQLRRLDTK